MTGVDIKPGATTRVEETAAPTSAAGPGKRTLTEQLGHGGGATSYIVQHGDTLPAIAAKLGTTVDALRRANADKLKSYKTRSGGTVQGFRAGDVIAAPGGASAASPATATEPVAEASAADDGDDLLLRIGGVKRPASAGETHGAEPAHGHDDHDHVGHDDGRADHGGTAHAATTAATGPQASPAAPTAAPTPAGAATASPAQAITTAPAPAPEVAPAAAAAPGETTAAPLSELSAQDRGAALSTFHTDELGEVDKKGMSVTGRAGARKRGAWLTAAQLQGAGKNKKGDAFVAAADALIGKTKFSEKQTEVIAAAREFAAAPKPLAPDQVRNGTINWSEAQLTLEGVSLNDDLKGRLTRYVQFLAWAGLVSGPSKAGSVMRSPQAAHKLAVGWMFDLVNNTDPGNSLHVAGNRQKLVASVTSHGGTDTDGNTWLKPATVDGLKERKDDDVALYEYIKKTAAPEARKVQVQTAIAAEGYRTPEKRHPNIMPGTFVSNHLLGEAVDLFPPFVLNNLFDPLIDAIALHFGLWRAVKDSASSPEHWHYERVGSPPGIEPGKH